MSESTKRRDLEDRELQLPDGSVLRYAMAPVSADSAPAPLVLGLHYGWAGEMPPRHGRDFLRVFLEPTFSGQGAMIAAPYCPELTWHHPRSEEAVLALLDHLQATCPVDPERVVLAGYSLGGMGTWYLGARYPERFAGGMAVAAAPVLYRNDEDEGSGLQTVLEQLRSGIVAWHEGLRAFPLTVVHSRSDELIPYTPVEKAVASVQRRGADVRFVTLENVGHYDSREYVGALRPFVPGLMGRS